MEKVQKILTAVQDAITWEIETAISPVNNLEIISMPLEKKHVLFFPVSQKESLRPTEIIHELLHALYAEQIHHLFSGHIFTRQTPEEHILTVAWACRSATDWFIDGKLYELLPEEEKREIKELFFGLTELLIEKQIETVTPDFLLQAGFIIAQAIKYLDMPVAVEGDLQRVVTAFLNTPTENPSIEALEGLINNLLFYTNLKVFLTKENGLQVWQIKTCL